MTDGSAGQTCPREAGKTCVFCDTTAGEPCPLEAPDPFVGSAIGATKAAGDCEGGEVCEACQ